MVAITSCFDLERRRRGLEVLEDRDVDEEDVLVEDDADADVDVDVVVVVVDEEVLVGA